MRTNEPRAAQMNMKELASFVRKEIDDYDYAGLNFDRAIGTPWPAEKVERLLAKFRLCLVQPYWLDVTIKDTIEQLSAGGTVERCAIVADDREGYLLAYLPKTNEFTLVRSDDEGGFASIGVNGDAVGCFLAI